jgi:triacylglycerol lipase
LRSRSILVAAVVAIFVAGAAACNTPTVKPSGQASTHTPVVFVHGWFEGNTIWGTYKNALTAAGYKNGDITNFGYNSTASGNNSGAATIAGQLATAVDAAIAYAKANGNPGASKVDIISHSYGSMVSRYCFELGGCAGKVNKWVSVAGADGGTAIASIPAALGQGSGRDMSNNSQVVQQLKAPANVQKAINDGVQVMVLWSTTDGVINPATNSQWPSPASPDPASNRQLTGVNHMSILTNQEAVSACVAFLGGGGTPPPTTRPGVTTRPVMTTQPVTTRPVMTTQPVTTRPVVTTRPAPTTTMMEHGDHGDH